MNWLTTVKLLLDKPKRMGTYNISSQELVYMLKDFLQEQEGKISAETMAKAWNYLAINNKWKDRLKAYSK